MRSLRNGNTRLDRDGDGIPCESICKMRGSSSSSTATRQDSSPGARPRQSRPAVAAVRGPARLISVGDGDTSRVMASHGHTVTVRLACIDAPETAQGESGSQATLHLKRMVAQGPLELRPQTVDRYGRIVAEVIADGRNVNLEMVRAGMAYAYRRYLSGCDKSAYLGAERLAEQRQLGVWRLGSSVQKPWDFRTNR